MSLVILDAATVYPADDSRWQVFGDVVVYDRTQVVDIVDRCSGAEMVLTNKVPFDAATIAALPDLKYIGVLATGYNIIDTEAARKSGIVVTNIPAYSTMSVAQQAVSLLLAITNRVADYAAADAKGAWCRCPDFSYRLADWHELAGKTFGIVGLGNTGLATAAIAVALGMKVLAYTSKPQSALPAGYAKADSLEQLFAKADVLSLHCPLTPDTRGLVNDRTLALMKPSAIIINTSRGPVVDEDALARALNNGTIAAAGLDVLCQEPPADDCPLIGARNCYITPHIAWASTEARERLFGIAIDNVKAFEKGKPINVVN
mgnify:FL=1